MSSNEQEKLWMAYLDGELSSAESVALDTSLSPEDRERLAAEMRFESALAEALRGDIKCPDAVWRRAEILVRNASRGHRKYRRLGWGGLLAAVAAIVILTVALTGEMFLQGTGSEDHILASAPISMEAFMAQSEVPGTLDAVQGYLEDHGINLRLASLEDAVAKGDAHGHMSTSLVGACEGDCPDHTMQAIMFDCCGEPVRILVAPLGSGGAKMLQVANEKNEVQRIGIVGEYVAAVVGEHPASGLLDLLQSPSHQVV